MSHSTSEIDVLIVGGGPTGLAASTLLSRQGVCSLLVERRAGTSTMPRARGVHRRSMEIFRTWGLAETLYAAQYPLRPERVWSSTLTGRISRREPITAGDYDESLSPERLCGCAQDVIEPLMREHAAGYPEAQLRFQTRLEALAKQGDVVSATLVDEQSGERAQIRAAYVIAADGPASAIRQAYGIAMEGPDALSDKLNILFRADVREWIDDPPPLLHIVDGPVKGTFVANGADGRFQFDVELEPGMWTSHSGPREAAQLVRSAVGADDLELEVLGTLPWRTAAQVADSYRAGRVFLAGDAAHRLTPMGGMGISTGIHDVHNLAWKLAMVLAGTAGDGLLDTYEAERRPVGLYNTNFSLRMWRGESSGEGLTDADLGQVYSSAAVIEKDANTTAGPTGLSDVRPGVRAPHVWVNTASGRVSTIDLFERELTLLSGPRGRAVVEAGAQAARLQGIELHTVTIGEPEWLSAYGVEADGAVLVRPDGIIAWRARTAPADPALELDAVLRVLRAAVEFDRSPVVLG